MNWQLIKENVLGRFSVVSLHELDYAKALEQSVANGIEGGRVYDALLLAAAEKSGADRIYAFNVAQFREIVGEELRKRIVAP